MVLVTKKGIDVSNIPAVQEAFGNVTDPTTPSSAAVAPVAEEKSSVPAPTFQNYLKTRTGDLLGRSKKKDGFTESAPQETLFDNIKAPRSYDFNKMNADEAAALGASLGGAVGVANMGTQGSIIGATVGGLIGRSVRQLRNGEHEMAGRRTQMLEAFSNMGINVDTNEELSNETVSLTGKTTRTPFESDNTSPFRNRSFSVARPIASLVSRGFLGFKGNQKIDNDSVDDATGVLINEFSKGARTIDDVYNNAKEFTKRNKISKNQLLAHLSGVSLDEKEQKEMERGLNILFES